VVYDDSDLTHEVVHENEYEPLTDKYKFNMALSAARNQADILSNHGTPTFLRYMDEMKIIESNARRGKSLLSSETPVVSETTPVFSSSPETTPAVSVSPETNTSNATIPNLRFEDRIKTKCRPKPKTKQHTFNKKEADRLRANEVESGYKPSAKRRRKYENAVTVTLPSATKAKRNKRKN